jgi:hypothetical protein
LRAGAAEVVLSPGELGTLRMALQDGPAGPCLVIDAARPETADLLRRHLDELRSELRADGLEIAVSIGGGSGPGRDGAPEGSMREGSGRDGPQGAGARPADPLPGLAAPPRPAVPASGGRAAGGHLDLRL